MNVDTNDVPAIVIMLEAEGEPEADKRNVASVIWNRAQGNPANLVREILRPHQFSSMRRGVSNAAARVSARLASRHPAVLRAWEQARAISAGMRAGVFRPTTDADHFYSPREMLGGQAPSWATNMDEVARSPGFVYLKDRPAALRRQPRR